MHYSLYLYSTATTDRSSVDASALHTYLAKHRFIRSHSGTESFTPGDQLMTYINYLGCSPSLLAGEMDVTVKTHVFDSLTALGGDTIETIRYPGCKHAIQDRAELLRNFIKRPDWLCPTCGNSGQFEQINWRKSVGISMLFIEITSIFPKEAIPTEKLLSMLKNFNQSEWLWFYSSSSENPLP